MCRRSIPEMEPRNTPETTNKKEKNQTQSQSFV